MGLLLAIAVIAVIYFLVKPNRHQPFSAFRNAEAESILKNRFVNGEIDEETYLTMLKTLRN